ncbi:MAG TPA: MsnO8 family LLM class oxidoreductase [Jatrophihabitans sp.]|jgi:luciferase family oxidoreductase group 1|uniref:MsnO8 family LLM class oxidoreductase n=1 Tax=Jatrophihabitans sp. TaxID=1932789 RepID=UPI002EE62D9A
MSNLRLSVLDQSPVPAGGSPAEALRSSLRLATILDNRGFVRYWFAEHHHSASFAGTTPEVLIAAALERTTQLRIGSGGVLLPRYNPVKVAEVFGVLSALHGHRLDLGLGRSGDNGDFPRQLIELHHHIDAQVEQGGLRPMIWLLGTGTGSSTLASRFGTGFAYGHFLNPSNPANARQALLHYQSQFQPSPQQPRPTTIITVRAVVAESESRAAELANSFVLWRTRRDLGMDVPFPTPEQARQHSWTLAENRTREGHAQALISGSAEQVRAELLALIDGLGVEEIMVNTPLADVEDRVESHLALADAFGLGQSAGSTPDLRASAVEPQLS